MADSEGSDLRLQVHGEDSVGVESDLKAVRFTLERVGSKLDCMRVDIDSVEKLLRATTFGEVSALPAGQRLEKVIARYTGSDVGRDIFELHDRYRDTVEIWLRS